jgi:hypothetical protein
MSAVFNGAVTIGGCVPGLQDAFNEVGAALETLRDEVLAHLSCFLEAIAAMADVRIAAVSDFQAQLNAAVGIQVQLTAQLANPAAYLAQLLAGLESLLGSLPLQLPAVALGTQISAAAAVEAVFAAKIALVDAKIAVVVNLLNACYAALLAVSTAAFSAIEKYHTFKALLATAGAYAFQYSGSLAGLGAAFDSVTLSSGVGTATSIVATMQFVKASDAAAVSAQSQCFLVN